MALDFSGKTIPHSEMRYDTCGDYWTDDVGVLQIRVSEMADPRYEFLIAVHEFVEKGLCHFAGITEERIDTFDFNFIGEGEPGDDPRSPYQMQHLMATGIEKMLCAALGIKWADYDKAVTEL